MTVTVSVDPAVPARLSPGPTVTGRSNLLVVGDDRIAAICTSGPLDACYVVEIAFTLDRALARLPTLQSGILLTELALPDGDGTQLCKAAKARGRLPIVLVITTDVARVPQALTAGCDSVLLKPFAPNLLFARLGRLTRDLKHPLAATTVGTNERWPAVECPKCGHAGATSFDATSFRRWWFACLECQNVWTAKRQH